jgi:hypothetical protein
MLFYVYHILVFWPTVTQPIFVRYPLQIHLHLHPWLDLWDLTFVEICIAPYPWWW